MEELKRMLLNIQHFCCSSSLLQQKSEIRAEMLELKEDLKNTINSNINEKFSSLEQKNEYLEQKLDEQSTKINYFERQIRRKNLVLFGVEEREKSYHELEELIMNTNILLDTLR